MKYSISDVTISDKMPFQSFPVWLELGDERAKLKNGRIAILIVELDVAIDPEPSFKFEFIPRPSCTKVIHFRDAFDFLVGRREL